MNAGAFEYRAMDKSGREQRGVARAGTREAAYRQVVAMGLTPLSFKAVSEVRTRRSKKIGVRDLAQFTYQLGVLIEARVPLSDGLATIAEQETNARLQRIVLDIAGRVQAGQTVSASLSEHRHVFGDVYVEGVKAAEHSGNMTKILTMLSEMLERQEETRRQIKGALMYPAVVVITLTLAVIFLVGFVVPRFATMFASRGVELPTLTKVLIAVGHTVRYDWWVWLSGAAVLVGLVRWAWRNPGMRLWMDRVFHRVPLVGQTLRGLAIARFSRVFALSLGSGVGLIESLLMSGRASGRPMLEADTRVMTDQVRVGGRLAEVLGRCEYFTPFSRRMITAGEQCGELPKMCETIARHYEREASHLTKNLGTVIEPVMVVLIAGVVLVVALAIFLPMWDMVKLVG